MSFIDKLFPKKQIQAEINQKSALKNKKVKCKEYCVNAQGALSAAIESLNEIASKLENTHEQINVGIAFSDASYNNSINSILEYKTSIQNSIAGLESILSAVSVEINKLTDTIESLTSQINSLYSSL